MSSVYDGKTLDIEELKKYPVAIRKRIIINYFSFYNTGISNSLNNFFNVLVQPRFAGEILSPSSLLRTIIYHKCFRGGQYLMNNNVQKNWKSLIICFLTFALLAASAYYLLFFQNLKICWFHCSLNWSFF